MIKNYEPIYATRIADTLPSNPDSCEEAAHVRGIPTSQELKTLVYPHKESFVILHLRGDKTVDWSKLEKMGIVPDRFKLANLKRYGLRNGAINPVSVQKFLPKSLSVLCSSVLKYDFMLTNDFGYLGKLSDVQAGTMSIDIQKWIGEPFEGVFADISN